MDLTVSTFQRIRQQTGAFGRNFALEKGETGKQFYTFKKQVRQAIAKQMRQVASNEQLLNELLILQKGEVNRNVVLYLKNKLKSISAFIKPEAFLAFYIWAGNVGGQSALDKMTITAKPFELQNEAIISHFAERTNLVVDLLDNTTQERLARLLEQGQKMALTNYETARLIKENIPGISELRADLIARNELAHAVNTVEFETFKQNQVKEVRWVTAMDDRVCDYCAPLHNTTLAIEQSFTSSVTNENTNKTTTYSVDRPPLHVNCRCYLEEVITGFTVRENQVVWTGA